MTIGVAWVRQGPDSKELWIASDSRLSHTGEYLWDSCAKLSTLPRRDAVLGFAGGTQEALPLMAHLVTAISSYRALTEGVLEFHHCIGHLELLINDMMNALILDPGVRKALPAEQAFSTGEDTIVIAGYSRRSDDFLIRFLQYQPDIKTWKFGRVTPVEDGERVFHVFGDSPSKALFRTRLHYRLENLGIRRSPELLGMEPFEVLMEMLSMPPAFARKIDGHFGVPPGYRPERLSRLFPQRDATIG